MPSARRTRLLAFAAIAASALVSAPARAEPTELPKTEAPAAPTDDTRFGAIGTAEGEAKEEAPIGAVGAGTTQLGRVTYASVRGDVAIARTWSIVPQAALLRVAPFHAGDPATTNAYVGGGVAVRPTQGWTVEASTLVGPRANQIASLGFSLGVAAELGADWAHDRPPLVTIEGSLAGTRFDWANGLGPAGKNLTQLYALAQASFRLGARASVQPRGMFFVYDERLDQAQGERLGSVTTLARVGSYAPRWLGGLRLGYRVLEFLTPFVEGDQIGYAAGIGHATQLLGGARVQLGKAAITAFGGAVLNRVGGPLVPTDVALGTVPLVGLEAELTL